VDDDDDDDDDKLYDVYSS